MTSRLNTPFQQFIAASKYARWIPEKNRRETWEETVDRYVNYVFDKHLEDFSELNVKEKIRQAILNLEVMPSMRALMTAGKALDRDHMASFNCSYLSVDNVVAFDEALYILTCGTGVGFSVERQFISKLPEIGFNRELFYLTLPEAYNGVDATELSWYDEDRNTIVVADSKYGWASALRLLIVNLYNSNFKIKWDVSAVRPAGSRLHTFGGRASGPAPLEDLFRFCKGIFKNAAGRKLNSLECHDIMCRIGDIVVVGGVRRSALISLSNVSDTRMRDAKHGEWFHQNPQRALANNSACYTEKPDMNIFIQEWKALYDSKSGERGIFSRIAAQKKAAENGRRESNYEFGTNPCSEIILRPMETCNLTEVVVRASDDYSSLAEKIKLATILGTIQSTFTDFVYLRPEWQKNCEEERLLGVSLTGIMDNSVMSGRVSPEQAHFGGGSSLENVLTNLKTVAISTNEDWSDYLGINQSAAITCVKPSGTVSQLVDSASGIHPRHNHYYIRTARADKKDPLTQFLIDEGFDAEDCVMKPETTMVFTFPQKAPPGAITRLDLSAVEHLEIWLKYAKFWCEHKPSITVSVREHEWLEVGAFVYKHFDQMSGISFLPFIEHIYPQAPYQDCDEEEYMKHWVKQPKEVNWDRLSQYETEDHTKGSQELACVGGSCDIV